MSNFVHLHVHTEYSLLDGISHIKKLVRKTKELGMEALAITDHGVMYGAIEFYKECRAAGIKPIIGCEMYFAPRSHLDKEGKVDTDPHHLTVLAKNYQGYLNLMKLVSVSWLEGYYYRPRIDLELLKKYHDGLIVLSGCPGGEFIKSLAEDGIKKAEMVAGQFLEIMGKGNYYFELQNHHWAQFSKQAEDETVKQDLEKMQKLQDLTFDCAKKLSLKMDIPIVATKDLHYIDKEDATAHDAVLCVQTGKLVSDVQRLRMIDTPDFYLASPAEMAEDFKGTPEAITNTVKIAQKVDIEIPLGNAKFPIYEPPVGKTANQYLRELTFEGVQKRMELNEERKERLEYELSIIEKKKYAAYFLVVQDFMNWANENGVISNTRGSAAGSLVLYALGVTNIDPIFYKLPFERFLNPLRPSLPDIDADLADDRREDVIRYVSHKYGEDKVAHIVTFGTMMGRAAIRDIGRVLAIPYGEVDKIAKMVPPPRQGFHTPLSEHLKTVPELAQVYKSNPEYAKMIDLAIKIEGTVRHASVHAAGIVISPEPLTNFTPLQKEASGDKVVTQYDMFGVEEVGLVKMDFLGIRNLSILGRAVEYVKINKGIEVDLKNIPLDDKKAFELLARGETMGLFQLEGSGMTKYLIDLKPTTIFDIMAMVALYRPGPIASIPDYIVRKHDPSKIKYFDPRMKDYMQQSLGLLVYQEDVLLTSINIAGYDWLEADKLRKAMGKKIPAEMAKEKDHFIKGAHSNGMSQQKAEELFALIEPFAAYGFPKAHAASYALISYQTAYMKANFPVEFMAAVMTAEYGNTDKIAAAMQECKKMGILVLPPDINYSKVGFTIEQVSVRFGLSAIKNVGILAIESIISAGEAKAFSSMFDLCSRVDTRLVNRKTLESLIKAGAMDALGSRAAQLLSLDACLGEVHRGLKVSLKGQESLFDSDEDVNLAPNFKLPEVEELSLDKLLSFEKELLGFYLHEPPYLNLLKQLEQYVPVKLSEIDDERINQKLTLGGVVTEVRKVVTKKSGAEMAFLVLSDGLNQINCVIFPKIYAESKHILDKEQVLLLTGRLDKRDDEYSLVVDYLEQFDPEAVLRIDKTKMEIEIPSGADGGVLKKINLTLRRFPGNAPISILLRNGSSLRKLNLTFTVDPNPNLVQNIEQILGPNSIRLI